MTTTASSSSPARTASSLRRLYIVRFVFAVVWAGLIFAAGSSLGTVTVTLLVLYPIFDVAAAIVDLRSNRATGASVLLVVNIVLSLLAALGLGLATTSGTPAVLRVWGAWAITAGAVQLIVGLRRRALGGQWIMIVSGGLSVLVGGAFLAMAGGASPSLTSMGGYAALGGIFFLISALRLGERPLSTTAKGL